MPRRKVLKGVANDLLAYFLSRNNDAEGYWAPGKLRRHAETNGAGQVFIDVIEESLVPSAPKFAAMCAAARDKLFASASSQGLPCERIAEAQLICDFALAPDTKLPLPRTSGRPFMLTLWLVDDLGRVYRASAIGHCRPHDPARERRRHAITAETVVLSPPAA